MKITIEANPYEIAALVVGLQERQEPRFVPFSCDGETVSYFDTNEPCVMDPKGTKTSD